MFIFNDKRFDENIIVIKGCGFAEDVLQTALIRFVELYYVHRKLLVELTNQQIKVLVELKVFECFDKNIYKMGKNFHSFRSRIRRLSDLKSIPVITNDFEAGFYIALSKALD